MTASTALEIFSCYYYYYYYYHHIVVVLIIICDAVAYLLTYVRSCVNSSHQ